MKTITTIIMFCLLSISISGLTIESTTGGGIWSAPSTWVGGQVPGSGDNVVINGLVYVNNHYMISALTVSPTGTLRTSSGVNWSLAVFGIFTNYGICENNPSSGGLILHLYSNIFNYGTISNYWINLNNASTITLYHDPAAPPIACQNLVSHTGGGNLQLLSDLRFQNCLIDLYTYTIYMSHNGSNYGISLSGGRLYRVNLDTDGFCDLTLSNGSYLYAVTGEDINLKGNVLIYQDISFENLTVAQNCTVNTWNAGNAYNLYVNNTLTCHGSIQSAPGNIYLRIYGNLYNYGTISSHYCYFMGTGFQYVYQDPGAQPFTCYNFGKPSSVSAGFVWLLSDLRFQNTTVDMYNRPLMLFDDNHSYGISLDGGKIYRTTLSTDGYADLTMSNDAYLYEVNAGNIITHGIVQTYGNVYFQNCVNLGTLRALTAIQYIQVYNDLINWGTIANDTDSNTYFRVAGDLYNYGTINCYQMALNGTGNQDCLIHGSVSVSRFTIMSMMGLAEWYFNDFIVVSGWDYRDVNPYNFGVWHIIAGFQSRDVILRGEAEVPDGPRNVALSVSGDRLLLSWNQVEGATYYKVYKTTDPYGTYTALPDLTYDADLTDGIVKRFFDPVDASACFKVVAGN